MHCPGGGVEITIDVSIDQEDFCLCRNSICSQSFSDLIDAQAKEAPANLLESDDHSEKALPVDIA